MIIWSLSDASWIELGNNIDGVYNSFINAIALL